MPTTLPAVISLGNMLVEIMRTGIDQPLHQPGLFAGPFPSGDTPIYVNAVARLGHRSGFLGAVGQDDFGRCLLDRFAEQGVDAGQVRHLPDRVTGMAFVAYAADGSRKFLFHWRDAACGQIDATYVDPAYFQAAQWLHLTGGNLIITGGSYRACLAALEAMPASAKVSFDPNIRAEWLDRGDIRRQWAPIVARADYILPSAGEAKLLMGAESDEAACRQLVAQGKVVLQKRGSLGCRVYAPGEEFTIPGCAVTEVDPTGAGDSFCAGWTVAMLDGLPLAEAARFANAVGALAVTQLGPMEGAPTRAEVAALLAAQPV
jgi:sugar/nucleoside kinase (ribokinase family)